METLYLGQRASNQKFHIVKCQNIKLLSVKENVPLSSALLDHHSVYFVVLNIPTYNFVFSESMNHCFQMYSTDPETSYSVFMVIPCENEQIAL